MLKVIISLLLLISIKLDILCQVKYINVDGKKIILYPNNTWIYEDSLPIKKITPQTISDLNIPRTPYKYPIIRHSAYNLQYNILEKFPIWLSYDLSKIQLEGNISRTSAFKSDPKISVKTNFDKDYKGSGFDRGHMVPAADMKWSEIAMTESFYYSNIMPQYPNFNRGVWKKLEEKVRDWVLENDKIMINVGPVIQPFDKTIGQNKIIVPSAFYKVILDYTLPEIKSIAFLIPSNTSSSNIEKYAISIDSLEKITNIDFFYNLPDDQENLIESNLCMKCWFKNVNQENSNYENQISNSVEKNINTHTVSVQCSGTTQKGDQCKNQTNNQNGFCYLHQDQANKEAIPKLPIRQPQGSNHTILTGPRGGNYYINSKGNKVYIKK